MIAGQPPPDALGARNFGLMPKTLATATVDRLMHHAHLCQTSGDSVRLTQALAGKGVIPLT
jgi:DNA replication protein DnaC